MYKGAHFAAGAHGRIPDDDFSQDQYGDEYDDEDYGSEQPGKYYVDDAGLIDGSGTYDDEDISDESGLIRQALIQRQLAAQEAAKKANAGALGQMALSTGSKPAFLQGTSSLAGGPQSMVGKTNLMGGLSAQPKPATSGGFIYGGASSQGGAASLFGAASAAQTGSTFQGGIGASSIGQAPKTGGGFAFGQASQFGGAASLFGSGTGSGLSGGLSGGMTGGLTSGLSAGLGAMSSGAADDPYNIDIDLTKIKRTAQPAKTFEEKTSAEKLKTMQDLAKESLATGAKSIMKKPGDAQQSNKTSVQFGQCLVFEYDKDSAANTQAKRVDSKDISDMRDEKTKIRDMLQAQENEEREKIQKLREMMKTQSQQLNDKAASPQKSQSDKKDKIDESIQESHSLSQSKDRDNKTQSYDTYDSHTKSLEQSSQKQGINYWPGKQAFDNNIDQSNKSDQQSEKPQVLSANAMEEYMKRQQAAKNNNQGARPSSAAPVKDISESSDKYTDEDFESISKSKGNSSQMDAAIRQIQEQKIKQQQQQNINNNFQSKIVQKYVKKCNVFTQTDMGKYSQMSPEEGLFANTTEWTLKKNLEDAELLIQEHLNSNAETKDQMLMIQEKMKRVETDYKDMRRELLGEKETNSRLREQLEQKARSVNMYQIEIESLIKQVDLADLKTREKEDELKLQQGEYDKKMQLQIERIMLRRHKDEERSNIELKKNHQLEVETLRSDLLTTKEEIDYLTKKIEKLDTENTSLRLGKGDNKRIKELENEIDFLKLQLEDAAKNGANKNLEQANPNKFARNIKKELNQDEQRQLQVEIQQLDQIVKGYQEENIKAVQNQRDLEHQLKEIRKLREQDQLKLKEYHLKQLKQKGGVFVEEDDEVDIKAQNLMGSAQAISQQQLQELYKKVEELQNIKENSQNDQIVQVRQFKNQIQKLRDEKQQASQMLHDIESIISQKDQEIIELRDQKKSQASDYEQQINDLNDKLRFFNENQRLMSEREIESRDQFKEFMDLKQQLVKYKEDKKRLNELEKKCKLLEETIKTKNPNSIGMLIQAAKTDVANDQQQESTRELKQQIERLNCERDFDQKEFETKLRTMRQELERVKQNYEAKGQKTPEAKKVKQLEEELQKTKDYYNKRIREIEDKHKFGKVTARTKQPQNYEKQISNDKELKELESLRQENEVLIKNNKVLAQKIADLEHSRIINRKSSFISVQDSQRSQVNTPKKEQDADQHLNFYQDQDSMIIEKTSPNKPPMKPKQQDSKLESSLNPFDLKTSQIKSIPQLLRIFSEIDLQKQFANRNQIKINQLYNTLRNDLAIEIKLEELNNLNQFLMNQMQDDDQAQFLDQDQSVMDLDFLKQLVKTKTQPTQIKSIDEQLSVENLKLELKRVKQLHQSDNDFMLQKNQQLQREILDHLSKQKEQNKIIVKLEAQKQRVEDLFKRNMKNNENDMSDQVQMLVRKIEFLEEQSQQRTKINQLQHEEPYLREIEMLKAKLTQERELKEQIIEKKNAEVRSFKSQLDSLLSEMQNQYAKSKKQTKVF